MSHSDKVRRDGYTDRNQKGKNAGTCFFITMDQATHGDSVLADCIGNPVGTPRTGFRQKNPFCVNFAGNRQNSRARIP